MLTNDSKDMLPCSCIIPQLYTYEVVDVAGGDEQEIKAVKVACNQCSIKEKFDVPVCYVHFPICKQLQLQG